MDRIAGVGRYLFIGVAFSLCVFSAVAADEPGRESYLQTPWERFTDEVEPEPIIVMVELQAEPAAVVYAEALDGRDDAQTKSVATVSARNQLAQIEREQINLLRELESGAVGAEVLYRLQRVYNGIAVRVEAGAVATIASLPGVQAIHPVAPVRLANSISVPFLGAPTAWTGPPGVTGDGVTIGIIDSGIDYIHLDFRGSGNADDYDANDPSTIDDGFFPTAKVVGGWDFAEDDPDPIDDPGGDEFGHGTHVAGTAAGLGVNTDWTHYTGPYDESTPFDELALGPGMAPDAELYSLRTFGGSSKYFGDPFALVTAAIEWSVDPDGDGDFSDHLDVINMSLGDIYGIGGQWVNDACNNAAMIGVAPVAAAGNSGDGFFLVSRPGAAIRSIGVAAIHDREDKVIGPVRVNQPANLAGDLLTQWQRFGANPSIAGTTADVVLPEPMDACGPLTNPTDIAGKIVLVDWLDCAPDVKAAFAEAAGAVGVIIDPTGWAQLPINYPSGDRVGIPVGMIGAVDAASLQAAMPGVNVTLKVEPYDIDLADVTMEFTSRGPRIPDALLKPDVAAPGGVMSAGAFSPVGSPQAAWGSGTSMATPHVAGAMALLRELHPDWTVEEHKALLMNTAVDVAGGPTNEPYESLNRVGAGRIDISRAAAAEVIAMVEEPEGLVSVSFGFVEVADTVDLGRTVEVINRGAETMVFDVGMDLRSDLPGAELSPSVSQISIEAGSTLTFTVDLAATVAELRDLCDPGASRYVPVKAPLGPELPTESTVLARECLNEEAGYLELVPQPPHQDHPTLRVPVHAALRPVSSMTANEDRLLVTDDETVHELHLGGSHLDSGTVAPGFRSLASAYELAEISPENPLLSDDYRSYDLGPIGATSDYGARVAAGQGLEDTVVSFAVVSRAPTPHPAPINTIVTIDRDRDGVFDVLLQSVPLIHWNTEISYSWAYWGDVYWTLVQDLQTGEYRWQYPINSLPEIGVSAGLFNTDAIILSANAADLGLTESASVFDYRVLTEVAFLGYVMDFSEAHTFDAARPGLHLTGEQTAPMFWDDLEGEVIPVKADRRAFVANGSEGLLLIHHHNASGERAQIIEVIPEIGEAPREVTGRVIP